MEVVFGSGQAQMDGPLSPSTLTTLPEHRWSPVNLNVRGLNSDLIVDLGIFAGLKSPPVLALGAVESVEITVPASNKQCSIGDRGRRVDYVAGLELPLQGS